MSVVILIIGCHRFHARPCIHMLFTQPLPPPLPGLSILLSSVFLIGTEELCCAAELDNPMQQKWTKPMRAGPEVEWTEDLAL